MQPVALLLASGRGSRLQAQLPKAYLPLQGTPLLLRCAQRLCLLRPRPELVVAVDPEHKAEHLAPLRGALGALDACICHGGATRQESMQRALAAAPADCDLVLIHDAARPFFSLEATQEAMRAAAAHGAALLAAPVPDTLKRDDGQGRVAGTLDRDGLWLAQTPQVLRRDLLEQALERAAAEGFAGTDDVSLVERLGVAVQLIPSTPLNLKITHPGDLPLAELLAAHHDRDSQA